MLKSFVFAGKTYQMDEYGNVLSLYKTDTGFKRMFPDKDGYLKMASKGIDGKAYNGFIHRLVYETWVGEIPEGMSIDHIDNDKLNNHYTNLQVLSMEENAAKGNAKHWKFLNPEGALVEVYNLEEFCRTNNLHPSHMAYVHAEKPSYHQHKGWRKYYE